MVHGATTPSAARATHRPLSTGTTGYTGHAWASHRERKSPPPRLSHRRTSGTWLQESASCRLLYQPISCTFRHLQVVEILFSFSFSSHKGESSQSAARTKHAHTWAWAWTWTLSNSSLVTAQTWFSHGLSETRLHLAIEDCTVGVANQGRGGTDDCLWVPFYRGGSGAILTVGEK